MYINIKIIEIIDTKQFTNCTINLDRKVMHEYVSR